MRALLTMLLLGAGCKVIDAPENLEELVVFGFVHYDDGQSWVDAAAEGLVPFVQADEGELADGYRVDSLGADHLAAAGIDRDAELDIIGAAGKVQLRSTLDEVAAALTYPHMDEVFSRTTAYDVVSETDRDCFLAGECPMHQHAGTRTVNQGFFGDATQAFSMVFRWAFLEDGMRALMIRTLVPEPTEMSTVWLRIDENYALNILFPNEDGTARLETNWVNARVIGVDIPDSVALDATLSGMQTQAEELDAWVEAQREE